MVGVHKGKLVTADFGCCKKNTLEILLIRIANNFGIYDSTLIISNTHCLRITRLYPDIYNFSTKKTSQTCKAKLFTYIEILEMGLNKAYVVPYLHHFVFNT